MDLLQLRYFITIAECQHITKAANLLHVSQPSLSKSLARFEDELGVQLFDRQGRHIVLNLYGRTVLAHAQAVFRELDQMTSDIARARQRQSATIRIGSVDAVYVNDWLPQFIEAHPEIMVRHHVASCAELEKRLADGEIDFAITDVRRLPDGVSALVLGDDEYLVLAPKTSPISDAAPQDFASFCGAPFICVPKTAGILRPIDMLSETAGCVPNIVFEGGSSLFARLLDMDYGNLIISRAQIANADYEQATAERFKIIRLSDAIARFQVHLIWRGSLAPAAQILLDHIREKTHQFHHIP